MFEILKSKFKSVTRICISCTVAFFAFLATSSAKKFDVRDPKSGRVVMTCDDSTEEVIISDEFADFREDGSLNSGADRALREALGAKSSVETRDRYGDRYTTSEWFFTKYHFWPTKIKFANVTYEVEWTHYKEGGILRSGSRMTITSNGGNYICPFCIHAFGCGQKFLSESEYEQPVNHYDEQPTKIKEILIIGKEFTSMPPMCFRGVGHIETFDASETNINSVPVRAFDWCELQRSLKKFNLSKYNTNYEIHPNSGIFVPRKRVYFNHVYKGGTTRLWYDELKDDFESNCIEIFREDLERRHREAIESHERQIDENPTMYCFSLYSTATPCCLTGDNLWSPCSLL